MRNSNSVTTLSEKQLYTKLEDTYAGKRFGEPFTIDLKHAPGHDMQCMYDLGLGKTLCLNRVIEPRTSQVFVQTVKDYPSGSTVLDFGAHWGYYSLLALANDCRVLAFEPLLMNLNILSKNLKDKKAVIFPYAITEKSEKSTLYCSAFDSSSGTLQKSGSKEIIRMQKAFEKSSGLRYTGKRIIKAEIECFSLDRIPIDYNAVSTVKIDVENAGMYILEHVYEKAKDGTAFFVEHCDGMIGFLRDKEILHAQYVEYNWIFLKGTYYKTKSRLKHEDEGFTEETV